MATPMQCGGLWARAAPRRPGRGRDHPDDGRYSGRRNPGSPPGGGNVQDGVLEGLAAGVPGGTTVLQFFSWQIQSRTDLGSIPPVPPPPNPALQNPGVLLRANSCMMECSALLRIKTMRAMFRAADERIPPTAARP